MTEVSTAFNFEHIPRNIDKSSIKTFLNTKGTYSLEYAIVNPQDVFINMHAVARGWFRKKKSLEHRTGDGCNSTICYRSWSSS
jgi:hypothetical protein